MRLLFLATVVHLSTHLKSLTRGENVLYKVLSIFNVDYLCFASKSQNENDKINQQIKPKSGGASFSFKE